MPLADAKHDRLAARASARLALDAAWPEVALVDLDVAAEGSLQLARLGHAFTQAAQQSVHGVAVQARELSDLDRRQVGGHAPHKAAESGLRDPGTDDVAVLHWKTAYPGTSGQAQLVMTRIKCYDDVGDLPSLRCRILRRAFSSCVRNSSMLRCASS